MQCGRREFLHSSELSEYLRHPLNLELEKKACSVVERYNKASLEISASWKTTENDGVKPSVEFLQLISDEPQISFSAGAHQFCLLHITLLNFSEEHRCRMISEGETAVACLPTNFEKQNGGNGNRNVSHTQSTQLSKVEVLRSPHECAEHSLRSLYQLSVRGFSVTR